MKKLCLVGIISCGKCSTGHVMYLLHLVIITSDSKKEMDQTSVLYYYCRLRIVPVFLNQTLEELPLHLLEFYSTRIPQLVCILVPGKKSVTKNLL